jgi:hypothetical protein
VVHAGQNPTAFLRCEFDVTSAGPVRLAFAAIDGLSLWIDGNPRPPQNEVKFDAAAGTHTITLAVDSVKRTQPLRLEIAPAAGSAAKVQIVVGK